MKKTSAKLTAEEYVKLLSVSPLQLSGGRVIVTGNVDLVKIPGGRKVRHLTSAEIHGKVIADKTCSLQTIRSCEIWGRVEVSGSRLEETSPDSKFLGSFYATGCPRLKTIAGEFSGDVDLSRSSVEEVPSIAYFKRNLWLEGCRHLRLVDCRVNGSLDASRSSLAVVGPRCRVRCGVFLSSCENLSEIGCIGNPEHLLLDGSAIRRLGPEFRCRQSISMRNCRALEKLPVLTAEEVTITSSQICALVTEPPNQFIIVEECPRLRKLSVSPQQKLFVRECPVADLRGVSKNVKTLEVSACPRLSDLSTDWRGNILLSHLPSLKQIPPSFACNGFLEIKDCPNLKSIAGKIGDGASFVRLSSLETLTRDLRVKGDLNVFSSETDVPLQLECIVEGKLSARHCQVRETSSRLSVSGLAVFSDCTRLRVVRGSFAGDLQISNSALRVLGADCEVGGNLCVLECDHLEMINCQVGGNLVVSAKNLRSLGPGFACSGTAKIFKCPYLRDIRGKVGKKIQCDRPIPAPRVSPSQQLQPA